MDTHQISITQTNYKKEKPNSETLGFGRIFTDHMFIMDYDEDLGGWHDPRIIPYQPITLEPSCMTFHYGQTVFEGLKAYRTHDKRVFLFRPEKNFERMNKSNDRLCIPHIDESFAIKALELLIDMDREWIPEREGTSLYIRPFIIATEPYLGVSPSRHYQFMIILSPVGAYYKEGINPVRIGVEKEYVRSVKGGTGMAKTGGNYSSSLKAQEMAEALGCSQVLWLDAIEKKYIEEVGSMNVFFKINGEIVTPSLNGSVLDGVTRNSIIQLLEHWDIPVTERRLSIQEIIEANKNGTLEEAFGTGTAAVVSPIGELLWNNEILAVNQGEIGNTTQKLYDTITGIQNGKIDDPFNWIKEVKESSKTHVYK